MYAHLIIHLCMEIYSKIYIIIKWGGGGNSRMRKENNKIVEEGIKNWKKTLKKWGGGNSTMRKENNKIVKEGIKN